MHEALCTRLALYIQTHLDQSLPLSALADVADMSAYHLQRVFSQVMGESPAAYVRRLRLEQAAFRLLLHDSPIVDIALDCGFASHETMARAFRRRFGVTPSHYRRRQQFALASQLQRTGKPGEAEHLPYHLSSTRVRRLSPLKIAFIRATGPYEQVDPELWNKLKVWSARQGHNARQVLLGIGHDSPSVTHPSRLRFDACISAPHNAVPRGDIRIAHLPPLLCAVTTHVGPYQSLPAAYGDLFSTLIGLPRHQIVGLPAIEFYRDAEILTQRDISRTDIHIPVVPVKRS